MRTSSWIQALSHYSTSTHLFLCSGRSRCALAALWEFRHWHRHWIRRKQARTQCGGPVSCHYDSADQEQIVREIFVQLNSELTQWLPMIPASDYEALKDLAAELCAQIICLTSARLKNPAFRTKMSGA